jgi:hypothetical protein
MNLGRRKQVATRLFLIFSFVLLFLSVLLFAAENPMSAQDNGNISVERNPKPLEGLPEDVNVLSSQEVSISDDSHPLSLGMDDEGKTNSPESGLEPLYEYHSAQSTTYLVPSGVVIHFTYEFETARQAQTAYDTMLTDEFLAGAPIVNGEELGIINTSATFIIWQDSEAGDQAYWYINAQDNVLTVLLVNGMPSENLTSLFQKLVKERVH